MQRHKRNTATPWSVVFWMIIICAVLQLLTTTFFRSIFCFQPREIPSLSFCLSLSYLLNEFSIWCLQRFECRNHIRVIQKMNKGNRLYICGTNAHSPKDYVLYVSENYFHLTYFYKNQCDSNFSIRLVFWNWGKQHLKYFYFKLLNMIENGMFPI